MTVDTAHLPGLLDGLDLIRADFPILGRTLADGHPLVYLDSANTSQKPQVVIDAMVDHLERHNANVHGEINHRLRKRQRVHHTATWLGRIRDQGNAALIRPCSFLHRGIRSRPGLSVAIAAATREDLAAVSVTMQPASTSLAR